MMISERAKSKLTSPIITASAKLEPHENFGEGRDRRGGHRPDGAGYCPLGGTCDDRAAQLSAGGLSRAAPPKFQAVFRRTAHVVDRHLDAIGGAGLAGVAADQFIVSTRFGGLCELHADSCGVVVCRRGG